MSTKFLEAHQRLLRWRADPVAFVRENFQVEPDPWQVAGLRDFADPGKPRLSFQACVGPGKSTLMAWMIWNFLSCYGNRGQHPKGAAVSITADNLKDNLWAELAKWLARSTFLKEAFEWNQERIYAKDHPSTWFLSARSWPKNASAEEQAKALAGYHSEYVGFFIDESGGIPTAVLRTAEQALATVVFGKIIQCGNPTDLEGMLYAASNKLRHQWTVHIITGDPDDATAWVHSPRARAGHKDDPACVCPTCWARKQIETYGRENPWVQSSILGKFPPSSLNALISAAEVEEAMQRDLPDEAYRWTAAKLGVDVARYGDDRTVIFPRQGLKAFDPTVLRHARDSAVATDLATRVLAERDTYSAETVIMDATGGWAAGTSDVLKASNLQTVNVQFHKPAINGKYLNKRAELWFTMAEWVKDGGALPNVPELVAELSQVTYLFLNGKFQVEPKDQVKKRLGRSPDLADALALTFGVPDTASRKTKSGGFRFYDGFSNAGWMGA